MSYHGSDFSWLWHVSCQVLAFPALILKGGVNLLGYSRIETGIGKRQTAIPLWVQIPSGDLKKHHAIGWYIPQDSRGHLSSSKLRRVALFLLKTNNQVICRRRLYTMHSLPNDMLLGIKEHSTWVHQHCSWLHDQTYPYVHSFRVCLFLTKDGHCVFVRVCMRFVP